MNQKTLLFFVAAVAFLLILLPTAHAAYTETYYVSAFGNDLNDGLTELTPFETLAKTAGVINSAGTDGDYLVIVMTDLTSTACARYYDNSVTITSPGATPVTVTRGIGFSTLNEPNRGQYNPAMLEIGGDVSPSGPQISLTLKNIIFDDDFLHEGTTFDHQKKGLGNSWATDNLIYVQDAIVASYSPNAKIILGDGAQLHNFGGMTALRATDGATAIMESGSLITESSTTATRQLSSTATDYRAVGEAAVTIAYGAHFYMYEGAKIENIANAHSIKFDQSGFSFKCFIDGEITGMKGNKGWDATDHSSNIQHEGRGFKSAIYFNRGTTLDPWTGAVGPAIIGENANIHHNA
ncbi:MAG: hypothetical protein FWH46_06065, partial [Methanimicrococcus sp.]|nr:hypothetical protein [Methanimicrococcus sp.]